METPQATPRPLGAPAFSDVSSVPWAQEAIEYLYLKDIVNGYGDGTYGVNDNVTREQFVKMLLTALGLSLYEIDSNDFADVEPGAWYEIYINSAMHYGIVNGISDTEFGVGQPISRQDMAVMSMRALDLINGDDEEDAAEEDTAEAGPADESENVDGDTADISGDADGDVSNASDGTDGDAADVSDDSAAAEETETAESERGASDADEAEGALGAEGETENAEDVLTAEEEAEYVRELFEGMTFTDKDEISDYAIESVARMAESGYLNGDDTGKFRPLSSSTRSETAVMIYRIMQ